MKYSKYLLTKDFVNIDGLKTDNVYLKIPVTLIAIPVVCTGIVFIGGMLPMAFVVDEMRNTRCVLIHFKRHGYKFSKESWVSGLNQQFAKLPYLNCVSKVRILHSPQKNFQHFCNFHLSIFV